MNHDQGVLLTAIIAIKNPPEAQFQACISAMAALEYAGRIGMTIVSAGPCPAIPQAIQNRLGRIRIIHQEPQGVYPAYNRGLDEPLGEFVFFMGADDLVLPGMDRVLATLDGLAKPDLAAACSLMQDIGISRPSRRRWALIFRNWCQQGLLYHSRVFNGKRFDPNYRIQADHKFNMELVADSRSVITYHSDVVAHFASNGLSQTAHDWAFRQDMPAIVRACYGNFFWAVALTKRKLADWIKGRRQP